MKNIYKKLKFSILNSQFSIPKGFTLVELLVVIGVMGVIATFGFASFSSFNNQQLLQSGAFDVKSMLHVARARALSQVKPQQCANETLLGYQVTLNTSSYQYALNVVCDTTYTIETKKLPKDISFRSDSTGIILFPVLSGNPSSTATIILEGYGKDQVIRVDTTGTIMMDVTAPQTNQPVIPTPTPADCPWWEWWDCTSGLAPTATPMPIPTPTRVPIATPTRVPTPTPTGVVIPTSTPTPTIVPKI